jgi:hypothetical protein
MEMSMTSLDSARFPSFETAPRTYETRTYGVGLPARTGSWFSGLDKIAYGLAAVMALGPLAVAAWGALVVGA